MQDTTNITRIQRKVRQLATVVVALACSVALAVISTASAFAYDRVDIDGTIAQGSAMVGIGYVDTSPNNSMNGGSAIGSVSGEGTIAIGINLRDTSADEGEPSPWNPQGNQQYVGLLSGETTNQIGLKVYNSKADIGDANRPDDVGQMTGEGNSLIGINLRDTSADEGEPSPWNPESNQQYVGLLSGETTNQIGLKVYNSKADIGDANRPDNVGQMTGEGNSLIGINLRDSRNADDYEEPSPWNPESNQQYVGLLSGETTNQIGLKVYNSMQDRPESERPEQVGQMTGEGSSLIGINLRDTSADEGEPTPWNPQGNQQYVGLLSGETTNQIGLKVYSSVPQHTPTYPIIFDTRGGSINTGYFSSYTEDDYGKAFPTDVTYPGHTFLGWYTEVDGYGNGVGEPVTELPAAAEGESEPRNLKYYAVWSQDAITVTWEANGSSDYPATFAVSDTSSEINQVDDDTLTQRIDIGASITGIENQTGVTLTRAGGWVHTGWCTEVDSNGEPVEGTKVDFSSGNVKAESETTYYATWERVITVTVPTYVDLKMHINSDGITVEPEREYEITSTNWPVDIVNIKAWDPNAITGTMDPDITDPSIAETPDAEKYDQMIKDNAAELFTDTWQNVNVAISGVPLKLATQAVDDTAVRVTHVVMEPNVAVFKYNLGTKAVANLANQLIPVDEDITPDGAVQKLYRTDMHYTLDNIDTSSVRLTDAETYDNRDIAHIMYVVQIKEK